MTAFFKQIRHNSYDFRYKIGQSGQRGTIARNDKIEGQSIQWQNEKVQMDKQ
jgi:hypothetical protein